MNIIEVKNNLVKLSYNENIALASFIKITDLKNSYIAQISHLEASRIGKVAIARLLFNFKNGIQAYDGSIPSIQAEIELLSNDFFINFLDKNDPLLIGRITQTNTNVVVSANLLKDKPIICAEKSYQSKQLIENLINQNKTENRKTIVFDTTGEVQGNKITATKDFKLPLNRDSISYIFDRGFDDLTQENKAFIQDIFSELNDYIKTVEYIPFNDFNSVIEYEFQRTQKLQLIILKNRLTEFERKGIFANELKDFKILDQKLEQDNSLIIDLSHLDDSIQVEYIEYAYKQMEKQNTNFYSLLMLNNNNSSAALLNRAFGTKNIFTSIVCPYSYKYLKELKQCSKNMFMFTPIKQQSDFGIYNIFLNRLAEDEFILYGKSTKFTPIIIKLEELQVDEIMPKMANQEVEEDITEDLSDEEIIVEENLEPDTDSNNEIVIDEIVPEEINQGGNQELEEDITEDISDEEIIVEENLESDTDSNNEIVIDEIVPEEVNQGVEEDITEDISDEEIIVEENIESDTTDEENLSEQIDEQETATTESFADTFNNISIDIDNEDLKNAINDRSEINNLLSQIQQSDPQIKSIEDEIVPLQNIDLKEIDEINGTENNDVTEEETELTDEDLDIIESLDAQLTEEAGDSTLPENQDEIKEINEPVIEIVEDEVIETDNSSLNETILEEDVPISTDIEETDEVSEQIQLVPPQENPSEEKESKDSKKRQSITDEILEEEARRNAELEALKPAPIEEQIEKPNSRQKSDSLETKTGSTPIVPVYSAEIPDEDIVESDDLKQGDKIVHAEFGRGIVEKIINYGERKLCSVNFEQVGRRLLDPKVSEMKKI